MHNCRTDINEESATLRARARQARGWLTLVLVTVAWLALPGFLRAQEALRSSLAIDQAERTRQARADVPYNLKVGEAKLRFSTSLGLEYNGNINVAENDGLADVIIRPELNTDIFWAVTDQNALNFSLGLGYSKFLDNDANDSLVIRPGSLLSFDVYVGDLRINLHDRFSFFQDPIQQGAVSGTNAAAARFGQAENVAGIGLEWDLNKLLLSAGIDYSLSFATSSEFQYLDRTSQYFYLRPAFLVAPEFTAGVEFTAGLNQYDQSQLNDSEQYSVGPFFDWQLSRFMRLGVRAGYQAYAFDGGTNEDTSSYYASINLDHDLNRYLRYSLGVGHVVSLGVNSDAINLSFVRTTARWQILRQTDISTDFFIEHGEEAGSTIITTNPETFDRFGASIAASYAVTRHLTTSLRYSFTIKESDQPLRSYKQNLVGLDFRYFF